MENSNRTQPTDLRWLLALCAAGGTFLLAFVPSDAWQNGAASPEKQLAAVLVKQFLTVFLMLIVPALWARLAHRTTPWVLTGLAALAYGCGVLFCGSASDALFTVLLIALPGIGLYFLQRYKLSNFRTVLYESVLILIALFGYACLPDLIRKGDAYAGAQWVIGLYEKTFTGIGASASDPAVAQLVSAMRESIGVYKMNAGAICVPLLLTFAMVCGLSNTLFSHLMNRRGGVALVGLPPFHQWRCERWYVILTAGLLIVTLLMRMAGAQNGDALAAVAEPLWRMPCALAGLSTVRKLAMLARKKWVFWVIVVLMVLLPTMTVLLLTAIGMLSSLRKPINVGEDGIRK